MRYVLSHTYMYIKQLKYNKTKRVALVAFAVSIASLASLASARAPQPKLVVGIVVEDLKSDILALLQDNFTPGGFNRLFNNGVYIANADFGGQLDATAATAMIYTGAAPSLNGIPSEEVFDRAQMRGIPVFHDAQYIGNYTTETMSPVALKATTITDEIKVAGGGANFAYAIAPSPSLSLIMAGHAGNCGTWLNNANESWATTTYYRDVPSSINTANRLFPLKARIDTMVWNPVYDREKYAILPEHLLFYPFKYTFSKATGPQRTTQFALSPKINDEVNSLAIKHLNDMKLGEHSTPDMLSVAYTAKQFVPTKNSDGRYELYDQYYQLDRNLQALFNEIDQKIGLRNTLVFLAATPPRPSSRRDDEKWNLPYGEFSSRKALSLLNLYLMAIYGNGEWANAYHNGQVFLNHKLIEDKQLNLSELRLQSARFLQRMAGVNRAYSLDEIIDGSSAHVTNLRRNTTFSLAGDIKLEIMPGWQIIDDFNHPNQRTEQVVRAAASTAPIFIMGPGITPHKIELPVDARSLAPTITSLLRIRSPNASTVAPLYLEGQ